MDIIDIMNDLLEYNDEQDKTKPLIFILSESDYAEFQATLEGGSVNGTTLVFQGVPVICENGGDILEVDTTTIWQ